MSDKKEIATLSIKISVDSTDLDKLEAQLKRIEGLMISTGLKQPASGGVIANSFDVFKCKGGGVFIPEAHISAASVRQLSELMSDKAKEAIEKIAKQSPTTTMTITTGINNNHEQSSAVAADAAGTLNKINEAFHNSGNKAFIAALDKSIDINIPVSHDEFKEFKQQIEGEFNQLQSSFMSIQNTMADSDKAITESLRQINLKLCRRTVR